MGDEYMPLRTVVDAADNEGFDTSPLELEEEQSNSSLSLWLAVVLSVFSMASALALSASLTANPALNYGDPKNLATLKSLTPYPNMNTSIMNDIKSDIKGTHPRPKLWFPGLMIRVNAAQPDEFYTHSKSVVLSPTDSMFFRWKREGRDHGKCYIRAVVHEWSILEAGGKSYYSEGDVTEIEIWNVTTPILKPTSLSWNTRPLRQNLLGTVNFTTQPIPTTRTKDYDARELRAPTPRMSCAGVTTIMVEIACKSCKLEFDQVWSDPALAFDIQELY